MVEDLVNYINEKEERAINIVMDTFYPDVEYEINYIARALCLKNCVVLYNPKTFEPTFYFIKKDGEKVKMSDIGIDKTLKRYCNIEGVRTIIER